MPSPFPGMNPYLENPDFWTAFHNRFIFCVSAALNRALPGSYFADIEERVYILPDEKHTYIHDVGVTDRPQIGENLQRGGVALAAEVDAPFRVGFYLEDVHEPYLEIRSDKGRGPIVTAIELLSPTNKDGNPGRESYLNKQADLLTSKTHFIEIDLLRAGTHTVAAPLELMPKKVERDYLVCLHRAGMGDSFDIWPNRLRNRLPRIAVPLEEGVPDVALDLQAVLNYCYDESSYERGLDYRSKPIPPLSPEDAAWADALLREKGLRP